MYYTCLNVKKLRLGKIMHLKSVITEIRKYKCKLGFNISDSIKILLSNFCDTREISVKITHYYTSFVSFPCLFNRDDIS